MMTITDARRVVGQRMFGPNFGGTVASYSALKQADQVALNAAVMRYIVDNPVQFRDDEVKQAQQVLSGGRVAKPMDDPSFSFSDFGNEFLNNARKINPLDPDNIKSVGYSLLIAGVIVAVAFVYINKGKGVKSLVS